MSIFESFLIIGIILINYLQVKFIYILKSDDPKMWNELGRPTLLNPWGAADFLFLLSKEYKSSKSKKLVRYGNLYRLASIILITTAIVYFIVPLEIWYG